MKTYTFKIKVAPEKVVCAAHMQLEQFFDSVKMTDFSKLLEKYPDAYITASDYFVDDIDKKFLFDDMTLSPLSSLISSKDLKAWLISDGFNGFVGEDVINDGNNSAKEE